MPRAASCSMGQAGMACAYRNAHTWARVILAGELLTTNLTSSAATDSDTMLVRMPGTGRLRDSCRLVGSNSACS